MNNKVSLFVGGNATSYDKGEQFLPFLLLVICVFIALTPVLLFRLDIWDGVIISYAISANIPEIFDTLYFEAGFPLGSWLFRFFTWILNTLSVSHKLFLNIYLTIFVALTSCQLYLLSRQVFGFTKFASFVVGAVYIFNPAWQILVSSIFAPLPMWNFLSIFALRLVLLQNTRFSTISGMILLCIACQYGANPALLMPIMLACFLGFTVLPRNLSNLTWIAFIGLYFFLFRNTFPAINLYEDYNSIAFEHILNSTSYFHYLEFFLSNYWPLLILFFLLLPLLVRARNGLGVLFYVSLVIATTIPFVLVDKSDVYADEWSSRVIVNFSIAVGLFYGYLTSLCTNTILKRAAKLLVIISIVISLISLYSGYTKKLRAHVYQTLFVDALSKVEKPEPGYIVLDSRGSYLPDSYELNYYFYRAYESSDWFVSVSYNGDIAKKHTANQLYRDKYVASNFQHKCSYVLSTKDRIGELTHLQLWMSFLLIEDFREQDVFSLELTKKGCTLGSPMRTITVDDPELSFYSIKQVDIQKCQTFTFYSGKWWIREPLVFSEECSVKFMDNAELVFNAASFMVINGNVFFPETGMAIFRGEQISDNSHKKWGGVLLNSQVSHVQYLKVIDTEGFIYNDIFYSAALNLKASKEGSIYRSHFENNYTAVAALSDNLRIHESGFLTNGTAIKNQSNGLTLIKNVFENNKVSAVELSHNSELVNVRNVFTHNALVIKGTTSSIVQSHFNFYAQNKALWALSFESKLQGEGDRIFLTEMRNSSHTDIFRVGGEKRILKDLLIIENLDELDDWYKDNFDGCRVCERYRFEPKVLH